jgi:hypothetical protein
VGEANQGPMLPETAARRMRWCMVSAVIECLGTGVLSRREGGGEATRRDETRLGVEWTGELGPCVGRGVTHGRRGGIACRGARGEGG